MLLSMGLGKTNTSIGMERKISEAPVQKYDLPHRLIHEIRRFIRLVDVVATSNLYNIFLKENYNWFLFIQIFLKRYNIIACSGDRSYVLHP